MSSLGFIKSTFIAATLAASALSASAAPKYDEQGLEQSPVCSYALPEALLSLQKQKPTGEKAQTPKWNIEVYANKEKTSWTLVGVSRAPDADTDEMCPLARGLGDYKAERWHLAYFQKGTAPKLAIADAPKLAAN